MTAIPTDHDAPPEAFYVPPPIDVPPPSRRRSPAEEARTLVASATAGTLATLTADGDPWASLVAYGVLEDGSPTFCVSTLAEHGRNLLADPRASLVVTDAGLPADPLDSGRVTVAGHAEQPVGTEREAALAAHVAAVPPAAGYAGFGDFSLWILRVERVRWVGGYGRMDSASAAEYRAAEPDPVAPNAAHAVRHLNQDHGDALLAMAQALSGYSDATAAICVRADRYGLDLRVTTPRGTAPARVGFTEPCDRPDGLRAATVELTRRAREGR